MENIKFVKEIMSQSSLRPQKIAGNFILFPMKNGNIAKLCCESNGLRAEIVNKKDGAVDRILFPFANYFSKKQCSPGAPLWDQHIDGGKWYFSQYSHVLPTDSDFKNLAVAVDEYVNIME